MMRDVLFGLVNGWHVSASQADEIVVYDYDGGEHIDPTLHQLHFLLATGNWVEVVIVGDLHMDEDERPDFLPDDSFIGETHLYPEAVTMWTAVYDR